GVVYPGGKMARFVTDGSPGDRMVRITVDPNDPSLLQGNGEAAGVGAVQRADGSDDGLRMRGRHGLSPPVFSPLYHSSAEREEVLPRDGCRGRELFFCFFRFCS